MTQLTLCQTLEQTPRRQRDYTKQCQEIADAIGDGVWRSLQQMESALGYRRTQTSISARFRNLRAGHLPGWTAESKHAKDGWWYRIMRADCVRR